VCNGTGGCATRPDGFTCSLGASCSGGKCIFGDRCEDDGQIHSPQRDPRPCDPFRCSKDTNACLNVCTSNLDCANGKVCAVDHTCTTPEPIDTSKPSTCGVARGAPREGLASALAAALVAFASAARRIKRHGRRR
jgi:hypothetical protein